MITYREMLSISDDLAPCDRRKDMKEMDEAELIVFMREDKSLKRLCQHLADHGVNLDGGVVPYLGSDMPAEMNMSMRLLAREPVFLEGGQEPSYHLYAGCWIDDIYFAHYVWWRA